MRMLTWTFCGKSSPVYFSTHHIRADFLFLPVQRTTLSFLCHAKCWLDCADMQYNYEEVEQKMHWLIIILCLCTRAHDNGQLDKLGVTNTKLTQNIVWREHFFLHNTSQENLIKKQVLFFGGRDSERDEIPQHTKFIRGVSFW